MTDRKHRVVVVSLVAVHLVLLLAYTMPRTWVPQRLQFLATRYVRPLFHQQWNLFAPDPPMCATAVEVGLPDGSWRPLVPADRGVLQQRLARRVTEWVFLEVQQGTRPLPPILSDALHGLTRAMGREGTDLRYRLVERCVVDPARPTERMERTIALQLAAP